MKSTDANHAAVMNALRKCGAWVCSTHKAGDGFPDLLVWVTWRFVLLEVKDGTQKPSAQALTPKERRFHTACPGPVYVVTSPEDAVRLLQRLRQEAA